MGKQNVLLVVTLFISITTVSFSWAQDEALNAEQVKQLFSGKTMTVTDPVQDKKTRENSTYEVQATDDGLLRVKGENDASHSRVWSVREDGSFCYSRPITRRRGGGTCGYLVPTEPGVYEMYLLKGKYSPNRKIIGAPGSEHILTF
ncbi:MAG: hypothetical protein ACWGN1_06365 [Desulfobulbales bacterium]